MTKVLSRDAIQRMISQRGGTTTVSGGGGEDGVNAAWVEGSYVAKNYWNQLFTVHGKRVVTVTDGTTGEETVTEEELTLPPNMLPSSQTVTDEETGDVTVTEVKIVSLQVKAGIWTNSFVSALGLNSEGGGGGGADLNALLASINNSAIGSVTPGASNVGKCLVWTADGWAWGTTGSGGGGTVTAITAGTGLSGGTITTSGTISISTEFQTRIANGQTAYGWGNHADAGYAKASDLSDYLPLSGGTLTGALHMGSTAGVSPFIYWGDGTYAYIGEDADDHITLRGDKGVNILTGSTYALSWNGDKLATQAWVEDQGFVTSSGVTSVGLSVPTGFTVSGSPVTTSGTLALGIASGYFMPTTTQRTTWNNKQDAISDLATIRSNASHGETAYGWGNHANAGYMLRTEGMRFTDYGSYIAARFVLADGSYDAARSGKAKGSGFIEWWSTGGYFNHHMGSVSISDGGSDTTCYLQIGGGRIYWDPQSKSFYVVQSDGSTAANIFATGGVSALGISTGGSPSVSALTVGTLNVTSYADISNLTLQSDMNANSCNIEMEGGNIKNVGDLTTDTINVNGTTISRIYWDGTYLQVKIGSNTYNFKPV